MRKILLILIFFIGCTDHREALETELYCNDLHKVAVKWLDITLDPNCKSIVVYDITIMDSLVYSKYDRLIDSMIDITKKAKEEALKGDLKPLSRTLDFAYRNGFGIPYEAFTKNEVLKLIKAYEKDIKVSEDNIRLEFNISLRGSESCQNQPQK
jgi:hypothetical protein